ncbi:hypothetical protein ACFL2J_04680 [Candidatus Omnitrophota bacterium]
MVNEEIPKKISDVEDSQGKKSSEDPNKLYVIIPDENRIYFNRKLEFGKAEREVDRVIKREGLVIIAFMIIYCIAVFMTFNVYSALLAVFGYPVYLVIRLVIWRTNL